MAGRAAVRGAAGHGRPRPHPGGRRAQCAGPGGTTPTDSPTRGRRPALFRRSRRPGGCGRARLFGRDRAQPDQPGARHAACAEQRRVTEYDGVTVTNYTEEDLRSALAADADAGATSPDVWPRLHRRIAVRRRVRLGAAVACAGIVAAGLVVVAPRLGGTDRIVPAAPGALTLTPNRSLSDAELNTAADIVRQQLDLIHVGSATVTTHDGTVDISAPGADPAQLNAVAAQGVLEFRSVTAMEAATSCPPTATGSVACSADGRVRYTLGPVALDNGDVTSADAVHDTVDDAWLVQLQFDGAGARKLHTLTADAADKPLLGECGPPRGCNSIAIVIDGIVVSAPSVQQPGGIPGGATQITGNLTRTDAQMLAAIVATEPLPTGFATDG